MRLGNVRASARLLDARRLARSAELFAGTPDAIEEALSAAQLINVAAGETLHRQGESAESLFLIIAGTAKLVQVTPDGEEILIRYFLPWDAVGVTCVLATNHDSTAVVTDDLEAIWWPAATVRLLLNRHPRLALNLVGILQRRLHDAQVAVTERSTRSVEQRLALLMLRLLKRVQADRAEPSAILHASCNELGTAAGTTIFTVSRILTRWEAHGLISRRFGEIAVTNPRSLAAIAAIDVDWADVPSV